MIKENNFSDGMKRAKCLHCKKEIFVAIAQYETSNTKKHLEKCNAYHVAKAFEGRGGEKRFEQKSHRDLLGTTIIRHRNSFS